MVQNSTEGGCRGVGKGGGSDGEGVTRCRRLVQGRGREGHGGWPSLSRQHCTQCITREGMEGRREGGQHGRLKGLSH